jgi:hypothetical protein
MVRRNDGAGEAMYYKRMRAKVKLNRKREEKGVVKRGVFLTITHRDETEAEVEAWLRDGTGEEGEYAGVVEDEVVGREGEVGDGEEGQMGAQDQVDDLDVSGGEEDGATGEDMEADAGEVGGTPPPAGSGVEEEEAARGTPPPDASDIDSDN